MCVLDVLSMRVKTASATGGCRPGRVDPLSLTLPPEVTASAGMDVVCHALEPYTARYYTTFDRKQPEQRADPEHPDVAMPVLPHPARPGHQRGTEHPGGRSCRRRRRCQCLRS